MSRIPTAALTIVLAACSFTPGSLGPRDGGPGNRDGSSDSVPDAAPCQAAGTSCAGDILRTCTTVGQQPAEQTCGWGCTGNAPSAACTQIAPSGGWEAPSTGDTTDFTGVASITLPDGAIINTTDGSITGANGTGSFRTAVTGVNGGIDYEQRMIGSTGRLVAVFRFKNLSISNLTLTGTHAVAFVSDEGITISGIINAVPACAFADTETPGPGGYAGADKNLDGNPAPPNGGGVHGATDNQGGGGGGHGGPGGSGGNNLLSGGATYGDDQISALVGGAGGGGGDNHANSGHGGGGGGAIHLLANGPIVFTAGGLNAGGCGGRAGKGSNDGGGGGGAGGAILIEAPTVSISATLAVNGGGGGGGATAADTVGEKGKLSRTPAAGGPAGGGSVGGTGAAGSLFFGLPGSTGSGGGGGGGPGRIRVNTRGGTANVTNATLSPSPDDIGSTYSEGTAVLR